VPFHLRGLYVSLVEEARLEELRNEVALAAIKQGLRSVVPVEALQVMSWQSLELRVCGVLDVDLNFLRRHTTYTSGLSETDPHIVHFWQALERMAAADLRKFIKFACNQERIPSAYPDEENGTLRHVPPYPMKIAPPDDSAWRSSAADERLIRAETCMFMVKLPQYSTLEVMMERLKQAISCRDDPLIG
jgi:E3 ubiquitin-protein ligase HECTD4